MRDLFSSVKALARSVRNEAPVPFTAGSGQGGLSLFSQPDLPVGDRAYDAYGAVGTLFAIVSQIMNAVAKTEWHLYKRSPMRDKKRRREIIAHPFLTVWDIPVPEVYTGRLFRETVQQHLDLVGEGVIVLNMIGDVIVEMWPVRPDRIQPIKHPKKFLTGYVYIGPNGEEVPLEKKQVIQIKYPNPADPYRGMGPVQSVLYDLDAARYSAEWNKNFFINGARPGGIIKFDYRMSDDEFADFLARWRMQHQGVANAHRVAVIENAEWVDTNFSMTDMQFVELRNLPRELIREAFAFPKPMLGTVDDVNRANAAAGKEIMAENQTVPRLDRWKDIVNAFLLPRFANGSAYELDYMDPVPINREDSDRERNSQWSAARNGVLSGYHPDDVSDAVGLPRMRWVGIPTPGAANEELDAETSEEGDDAVRSKVRV